MKIILSIILMLSIIVSGMVPINFSAKVAKAANESVVRGILNYNKDVAEPYGVKSFGPDATIDSMRILDMTQKSGNRMTMGTSSNPLMILELVPWQGYGEIGYMIEGCEPVDIYTRAGCYSREKAAYYRSIGEENTYNKYLGPTGGLSWVNSGAVVLQCFADEDYPGKGLTKEDPDYKYRWFHESKSKTIQGYYEKVAGTFIQGNFNITGIDDKGRPVFGKTESGKGDFVWVSLGIQAPNYNYHAQKENKPAFAADTSLNIVKDAYAPGDREYTMRTDNEYWFMPNSYQVDEDGTVYNDLVPKSKFVHYNDFLRYALQLKTIEEVENYSVVVKTVEPTQLRNHSSYVDYADLIWIHQDSELGIALNVGSAEESEIFMKDGNITANDKSSFFDDNNDIGWEVAEKLYFKANGLTKYSYKSDGSMDKVLIDYSGNGQFSYAPVIMGKTLIEDIQGGSLHDDSSYYLNYDGMTLNKTYSGINKGWENNFYKFCLMNVLMDQDAFYNRFYTPQASTHQPAIQTIHGEGYHTVQEGDAQTFWCSESFLPYVEGVTNQEAWGTDAGKAVLDQYKINMYANAFMNFPRETVLTYTYLYNSNSELFVLGSNDSFDQDGQFTLGIHEWFDSRGEKREFLSYMDVMFFLLHYQKTKKPLDSEPDPTQAPTQEPPATNPPSATTKASVSQPQKVKKPDKVAGVTVTVKKKQVKISWKKRTGVAGYQLQYARNRRFTKKRKSMNVRTHSGIIRGLKKNKVYYVRVRAYKRISGNKVYGTWSKIKKVRIR